MEFTGSKKVMGIGEIKDNKLSCMQKTCFDLITYLFCEVV